MATAKRATSGDDTAEKRPVKKTAPRATAKKSSATKKATATKKSSTSSTRKTASASTSNKANSASSSPAPAGDPRPSREAVKAAVLASADAERKQRNFYVSVDVIDRLERLVYWSKAGVLDAMKRGEQVDTELIPDNYSTTVEAALWAEILLNEQLLNDGEPFPPKPEGRRAPTGPSQAGAARLSQKARQRHSQ